MIAIALAVKLSDAGPALFTQTRVGKDGGCSRSTSSARWWWTPRSGWPSCASRTSIDGVLFKMRRDPRITAVGAHLRKWSLDELPQLINVLLGEMSLVGPRPALPDETARYADHVRRRLVVKPGLTGLWQVSGRSDLSWDESVRLDLRYVENWSLALDLQILWKTVAVMSQGIRRVLTRSSRASRTRGGNDRDGGSGVRRLEHRQRSALERLSLESRPRAPRARRSPAGCAKPRWGICRPGIGWSISTPGSSGPSPRDSNSSRATRPMWCRPPGCG